MSNTTSNIDSEENNKPTQQQNILQPVEASATISEEESNNIEYMNYNNNVYVGNSDGDYWLDNESNTSVRRKTLCGCLCCYAKGLLIWIWVAAILLIFGLIYAIVVLVTYQQCYHLTENFDSIEPKIISYDPNIYNNFIIDDLNNIREGEIIVSQNNLSNNNNNNATLSIRLSTIKKFDSYINTNFKDSTFNLQILRKSFPNSRKFAWLGYLSIPPKCIAAQLELTLPTTTTTSSTIQINSNQFNVKFDPHFNFIYSNSFNLETTGSDIIFKNNSLTNQLLIATHDGNINGNIFQSTKSELNISTESGFVNLNLNIINLLNNNNVNNEEEQSNIKVMATKGTIDLDINIQEGVKSPNIDINSIDSDISIEFNGSFNGQYDIKSSGEVKIEKNLQVLSKTNDNIGNFNNMLLIGNINIQSTNGDIDVQF